MLVPAGAKQLLVAEANEAFLIGPNLMQVHVRVAGLLVLGDLVALSPTNEVRWRVFFTGERVSNFSH